MSGTKTFLMVLLIVSATEGLEMAGLESLDEMGWNRVGPRELRTSAAGSDSPMVVLILQLGCGHCTKLVDSLPSAMLPVHVEF
jgi:hypothetical protein